MEFESIANEVETNQTISETEKTDVIKKSPCQFPKAFYT